MKFELTVLGCGSATPTKRHAPTAQIVNCESQQFLFDCGEGTQLQLRKFGLKFQKINHIFITHLHGDHCLGLPGLISTMHLLGRTNDLHIYSNHDLKWATEAQFTISHSRIRFPIIWHDLQYESKSLIWENNFLKVESFPLKHRVPCCGFIISEKEKQRNIIAKYIEKYNIPIARIRQIKAGADYALEDGSVIANDKLTVSPPKARSYAFCTDTIFTEKTAEYVGSVDLIYHESTFLDIDIVRAKKTYHSTASQAATIARLCGAKRLLLGHYSARYKDTGHFLREASEIFDNTVLAEEGLKLEI